MRVTTRTSPSMARPAMRCCSISRSRQANATLVMWSFGTRLAMPTYPMIRNVLGNDASRGRKAQYGQEAHRIGDHGDEYAARHGRVSSGPLQRQRHENAGEPGDDDVDEHGRSDQRAERRAAQNDGNTRADEQRDGQAV